MNGYGTGFGIEQGGLKTVAASVRNMPAGVVAAV